MFDVGFSELVVIGIVALIVIGPERMPAVARTVGALLGRLQRYVRDVKSEINREMRLDELRRMQTQIQDEVHAIGHSVEKEVRETEADIQQALAEPEPKVSEQAIEPPTPIVEAPRKNLGPH